MKKIFKNKFYVLLILTCTGFLFYANILNNNYFSDDFSVIKRLTLDKQFWPPGFFRPLSDLSILFCASVFGISPFSQYLFNVLLLVASSFFVYRFFVLYFKDINSKYDIGFLAALLFILYPFHNETIVWVVGRASILAGFLGIAAICSVFSGRALWQKILLSNIFFFLALAAYESVFPLPGILLILLYNKKTDIRKYFLWLSTYVVTFILHIACRIYFANIIFGNYQKDGLQLGITDYIVNFLKAFARSFIMPIENNKIFIGSCISLIIIAGIVLYKLFFKQKDYFFKIEWAKFFLCFLASLIIPCFFSVSVKTSEGDRMLYFPSFFLIILVVMLLYAVYEKKKIFYSSLTLIIFYFGLNIILNNNNWRKASAIIDTSVSSIKQMTKDEKKNVIINIPDSYNGAYIFRNGFKECMMLNKIDTAKISYAGFFMFEDAAATNTTLEIQENKGNYAIPGFCSIIKSTKDSNYLLTIKDTLFFNADIRKEVLWYWNKQAYKKILP